MIIIFVAILLLATYIWGFIDGAEPIDWLKSRYLWNYKLLELMKEHPDAELTGRIRTKYKDGTIESLHSIVKMHVSNVTEDMISHRKVIAITVENDDIDDYSLFHKIRS